MSRFVLPEAYQLRHHLEMLFGKGVVVNPADKLGADAPFCGIYRDDAKAPVGLCLCDMAFAAYAGGALCMMMPNDARIASQKSELPEVMRANLYEVMNILSRLFMNDHTPHLKLVEMCSPPGIDATIKGIATSPEEHMSFKVELPRYGAGQITFALT
jgi:hypothetical protein